MTQPEVFDVVVGAGAAALHRDGQDVGGAVEAELYRAARRHREGDVGATLHAALAEIDIPAFVERDLGLVAAGRDLVGAEGVGAVAVDILQPGAQAIGLPVAGTADFALEGAGHGGDDAVAVAGDPVRLVVIEELDVVAVAQVERDVGATRHCVGAVVLVPRAVERGLVFVAAGGQGEGCLPDVVVGVEE